MDDGSEVYLYDSPTLAIHARLRDDDVRSDQKECILAIFWCRFRNLIVYRNIMSNMTNALLASLLHYYCILYHTSFHYLNMQQIPVPVYTTTTTTTTTS